MKTMLQINENTVVILIIKVITIITSSNIIVSINIDVIITTICIQFIMALHVRIFAILFVLATLRRLSPNLALDNVCVI